MPWRLPGEFVVSCNCVRGLDGAGVVGQGQGGVERVAQECAGARAPAAREVLVDAQAGEEIWPGCCRPRPAPARESPRHNGSAGSCR